MFKKNNSSYGIRDALICGIVIIALALLFFENPWKIISVGIVVIVISIVILVEILSNRGFNDSSFVKGMKSVKPKQKKHTQSFIEFLEDDKKKEAKKKKQQLEKEMDNYGLSEDEKKLVRSGEYEPYEFEEEENDEDDYYSDDDTILSIMNDKH